MDEELVLKTSSTETYWGFDSLRLRILPYGVTGNTSDFGSEESRFDPWWGNNKHLWPRGEVEVCKTFYTGSIPVKCSDGDYSSVGQNAGLWFRRSSVRTRLATPMEGYPSGEGDSLLNC
jgi:hypothetical protein